MFNLQAATLHEINLASTKTECVATYNQEVDGAEVLATCAFIVSFHQKGIKT